MEKLNISLVFIPQSYFSVPKDVRLNSTHSLIMKINNRKELQNIVINHSTDIDYKDFVKIYRECTRKPYSFFTIDTTLPASDPLRFRKNLFSSYNSDSNWSAKNYWQKKKKANQAQYDFDRLAAKISAYSSPDDLRRYEYLTGEDLGYKPSILEQKKFDYSPFGKVFNKGLYEKDKKRAFEDKNKEQLELFSKANKISRPAKNESDYNYNIKFACYNFYRDFENFRKRSLGSKYSNISKFYNLLNEFKTHKATTTETKGRKTKVMNYVVNLFNYYFGFYVKNYDKSHLDEKQGCNPKQF